MDFEVFFLQRYAYTCAKTKNRNNERYFQRRLCGLFKNLVSEVYVNIKNHIYSEFNDPVKVPQKHFHKFVINLN